MSEPCPGPCRGRTDVLSLAAPWRARCASSCSAPCWPASCLWGTVVSAPTLRTVEGTPREEGGSGDRGDALTLPQRGEWVPVAWGDTAGPGGWGARRQAGGHARKPVHRERGRDRERWREALPTARASPWGGTGSEERPRPRENEVPAGASTLRAARPGGGTAQLQAGQRGLLCLPERGESECSQRRGRRSRARGRAGARQLSGSWAERRDGARGAGRGHPVCGDEEREQGEPTRGRAG